MNSEGSKDNESSNERLEKDRGEQSSRGQGIRNHSRWNTALKEPRYSLLSGLCLYFLDPPAQSKP